MNNNKKKFHYDEDWIDVFSEYIDSNAVESDFDGFWQDVQEYANQLGVGTRYVEEEFIIDGELHVIDLQLEHPDNI